MESTRRTTRRLHQPPRVLAASAALILGAGLGLAPTLGATAAPGDESHASATFLGGTLLAGLDPTTLALLGTASASNDGTQPTQLDANGLDATVLQALSLEIGGGLDVPLTLGDVGALQAYARAEADGSSVAASGLVGDDGAIGAGAPGAGAAPGALTIDLTDVLLPVIGGEFADVDLVLDAVSAGASSIAGGTPVGDYEVLGGDLVFTSATLAGVEDELADAVDAVEAALAALAGPDGPLLEGIVDIPELLEIVGVEAGATATSPPATCRPRSRPSTSPVRAPSAPSP